MCYGCPWDVGHLVEAQLEEVLHSLGLRIRSLFAWAKSDVCGFDDLSPLDQKALLRRTVPELVMLGFAKCSVPYDSKTHPHAHTHTYKCTPTCTHIVHSILSYPGALGPRGVRNSDLPVTQIIMYV